MTRRNNVRAGRNRRAALLLVMIAAVGCEYTPPGPPWHYPTTEVRGRVTVDGRALEAGWVILYPLEGVEGDHATARIGSDGRFQASGVPIGTLRVQIEPPPTARARLEPFRRIDSPLRFSTRAEPTALNLDF